MQNKKKFSILSTRKNCIQKYSDIQETQKKNHFKFASFFIESTNYLIST